MATEVCCFSGVCLPAFTSRDISLRFPCLSCDVPNAQEASPRCSEDVSTFCTVETEAMLVPDVFLNASVSNILISVMQASASPKRDWRQRVSFNKDNPYTVVGIGAFVEGI